MVASLTWLGGVELGEVLEPGEAGFDDPAVPASGVAVVDFGGEHFGEVAAVGESLFGGLVGEAAGFGADGGQVQLPAGRHDRRFSGRFCLRDRAHWSAPAASRSS